MNAVVSRPGEPSITQKILVRHFLSLARESRKKTNSLLRSCSSRTRRVATLVVVVVVVDDEDTDFVVPIRSIPRLKSIAIRALVWTY